MKEKKVTYQHTNSYDTLNELTEETTHIWLVFHGMGYLSKYFIHYFNGLDPKQHYIIAPQAPSKYYQDPSFKRIGACWLTRENTIQETKNILNYIDAIYDNEIKGKGKKLMLMGYSQGVSIVMRWLKHRQVDCEALILHSGGIPVELEKGDFDFLSENKPVYLVYGNRDPYITEERKMTENEKAIKLFNKRLEVVEFEGIHEVNEEAFLKVVDGASTGSATDEK